jgi:hypothetical protein
MLRMASVSRMWRDVENLNSSVHSLAALYIGAGSKSCCCYLDQEGLLWLRPRNPHFTLSR